MSEIIKILIESGDFDKSEAVAVLKEMRTRVNEGEDPEEVLYDYGLEPDYVEELF
jgi:hypothetical protein